MQFSKLLALCGALVAPFGSYAGEPNHDEEEGNVVVLSPFTVSSEADVGYYASNSISGTRIQTKIKDLPQVLNIVTSEFIADIGAVDMTAMLQYAASVEPAGEASGGRYAVRGFLENSPAYNGISTTFFTRWDSAVIERIEVVKGPSASLYGSNFEPGGFVNIITKKPQAALMHLFSVEASSDGRERVTLDSTGKLDAKGDVLYRLIGVAQNGSARNFVDFAGGSRWVVSPSLTWRVFPKTNLTIEYYRDSVDQDNFNSQVVPLRNDGAYRQSEFFLEAYKRLGNGFTVNGPDTYDRYDVETLTAYLTHQFSDELSFRAIYQNTDLSESFLRNNTFLLSSSDPYLLAPNVLQRDFGLKQSTLRGDMTFHKSGTLGDLLVMVGAQGQLKGNDIQTQAADPNDVPFPLFTATIDDYRLNDPSTYTVNQDQLTQSRGSALWNAVVDYTFWDGRLKVFGGYSDLLAAGESRQISFNAGQTKANIPYQDNPTDPADWQIGGLWNVTRQWNIFALHAEDQRLGDFNLSTTDPNDRFDNIVAESNEFGLKFNFEDFGFSGTVSYFEIERSGVVRRDFSQETAPQLPVGSESMKGAEMEVFYTPAKVSNLSIMFAYSHLDGEINGFSGTEAIYNGSPLRNAPKHSLKTWAKYKFKQRPLKGFSVGCGIVYRDEMAPFGGVTQALRPFAMAPSHVLLNLLFAYSYPLTDGRSLDVQINIENVTDELYMEASSIGAPRTAVLRVAYRF